MKVSVRHAFAAVTALALAMSCAADAGTVVEPAREIPVAAEVDVLVVGGTSAGAETLAALMDGRQEVWTRRNYSYGRLSRHGRRPLQGVTLRF